MTIRNLNCHFQPIPCVIEKFRLIVLSLYIKAIIRNSLEFSELLLWRDTQSFDTRGIPPRLEVLPLTQSTKRNEKILTQKCGIDTIHLWNVEVASLRLDQITLQPKFDLSNVTCIYRSIYSVMLYYFGGDKY